jgi:hypothetical protein
VIDVMEAAAKLAGEGGVTCDIIKSRVLAPMDGYNRYSKLKDMRADLWSSIRPNVLSKVTKRNKVRRSVDVLMLLYKACNRNVKYDDTGDMQEQSIARAAHPKALCVPWLREIERLPTACDEIKKLPLSKAKKGGKNQEEIESGVPV